MLALNTGSLAGLNCCSSDHWTTGEPAAFAFLFICLIPNKPAMANNSFYLAMAKRAMTKKILKCVLCIFMLYCSSDTSLSTSVEEVFFIFA